MKIQKNNWKVRLEKFVSVSIFNKNKQNSSANTTLKSEMRPGSGNVSRNSLGSSGGNSGLGTAAGARPGSGMRKPPGSARLRTGLTCCVEKLIYYGQKSAVQF